MRTVMDAQLRRDVILDAAEELFGKKGYDGTSTNDILEKVGIARGTLYYHFKSKEDILDALIERYNKQLVNAASEIAKDRSISVRERLVRATLALNINNGSGREVIEQMHKPQNALMHQKTQMLILRGVTPIIAGLIEEGIAEGLFETPFPYGSIEMIMTYVCVFFDDAMELTQEERTGRIQAFIYNTERLLGVESGGLTEEVMRIFKGPTGENNE